MLEYTVYILMFIFGSVIGSFLNVVILRYNTGQSLAGRSGCMSCGARLRSWHLIPILSYLALRGRCHSCKVPISRQYPLVEGLSGALFALTTWFAHIYTIGAVQFFVLLAIMPILVVLLTYDARHKILPDPYVYAFIALSGLFAVVDARSLGDLMWYVLGAFVTFMPIYALWFFSRGRAMGFGDVKFSVGIGLLLGVYLGISALWYAFVLGAVYGVTIMLTKHAHLKSEVPFGPFLIAGTLLALFSELGFLDIAGWLLW